jgi:hypothetical protein
VDDQLKPVPRPAVGFSNLLVRTKGSLAIIQMILGQIDALRGCLRHVSCFARAILSINQSIVVIDVRVFSDVFLVFGATTMAHQAHLLKGMFWMRNARVPLQHQRRATGSRIPISSAISKASLKGHHEHRMIIPSAQTQRAQAIPPSRIYPSNVLSISLLPPTPFLHPAPGAIASFCLWI